MRDYACIFDMDGTLIDSEPNYFEADTLFLESFGIAYGEAERDSMIGRGSLEFFRMIEERHPENSLNYLPLEERLRLKDETYICFARGKTFAFPGMRRLLSLLEGSGFPMAVASGSSKDIIQQSLSYAGLSEFFRVTVSAEEVGRGKPEPDVFLEASRRLGIPASRACVVEDSQYGVMAAQRAGMRVIGVPSPVSGSLPAPFEGCDLLFRHGMPSFDPQSAFAAILAWAD